MFSETMSTYSIVFYNVENLFDYHDDPLNPGDDSYTPEGIYQWTEERYSDKIKKIAEALFMGHNDSPLVIGLTEIENAGVVRDLIHAFPKNNTEYAFYHREMEDSRGLDLAFIYNKEKLNIIETKCIPVRLESQPNWNTRDILYVKAQINTEKEIHFFLNHWPSRREGTNRSKKKRFAAAKTLKEEIDRVFAEDSLANIIIMGDFNDTPLDKSLFLVLNAKTKNELQNIDLVNLLVEEEKHNKGTTVFRGDWMVFDQFIVSKALFLAKSDYKVCKNNAFIVKDPRLLYIYSNGNSKPNPTFGGENYYGGYSDHLPVFITLENV